MRPIIPPLTSLRFFAALFVVVFHYNLTHPLFPASLANFGYEAVTFFFMLSGFVLAYNHGIPGAGINVTYRTFLFARLVRICPAYYLAILSVFLLFFIAGISDRLTAAQVLPVIFFVQAWVKEFALNLNPPAWSISNEMFFYLIFPVLWAASRLVSAASFIATSAALVLLIALARDISFCGLNGSVFGPFSPLANLPQFIFGIGLGYYFLVRDLTRNHYQTLFFAGLAFVISSIVLKPLVNLVTSDLALSCAFGLLVLGTAGMRGNIEKALSRRTLVVLGDASYSLYILHFPIWLWWNHYTRIVYAVGWPASVDFGSYFAILLAASLATLFFLERPVRRRFQREQLTTK
jgi:peptidoglycan/LPS O-acetylase OafA/YrhL